MVTMSQKSSFPQAAIFVSQVLMSDSQPEKTFSTVSAKSGSNPWCNKETGSN
jgi:hypothetical protein